MGYAKKNQRPDERGRVTATMQGVDGLKDRELDAAVQREVMDSVIGWILMPNGAREPVFVPRRAGGRDPVSSLQPKWVPRYSTESAEAAAIDQRIEMLGLTDWYERNFMDTNARPEDKCRAALIAVRAARAIQRSKVCAS